MNIIFKGLCPICHTLIKDDDSDDLLYCDYYYCPNMCYQLYANSREMMVTVNVLDYVVKYNVDRKRIVSEVINSSGEQVLLLNSLLPINWKDLPATIHKIKSLIIFS
jgi:hypothetical protein